MKKMNRDAKLILLETLERFNQDEIASVELTIKNKLYPIEKGSVYQIDDNFLFIQTEDSFTLLDLDSITALRTFGGKPYLGLSEINKTSKRKI